MADKVLAAIHKLSDKPIRYIINTHVHADHTGGNEELAKAGSTIAGGNFAGTSASARHGRQRSAHENVLNAMSAPTASQTRQCPPPPGPDRYLLRRQKDMFFNGEAIQIVSSARRAHRRRQHGVLPPLRRDSAPAISSRPDGYPIIDLDARRQHSTALVAALNRIIDITIPAEKQEGGTYVIPGHGRLCDEADVVEYRDMATIIRDRIQDMVKKGMTLEQVKAAKPTRDYDPLYAAGNEAAIDRFVTNAYNSLSNPPKD